MVKEIVKDPVLLSRRSEIADAGDIDTANDLLQTLVENRSRCVGMAANMIGVLKRIIVFYDGDKPKLMLNPEIIKADGKYETAEGCLSLSGERRTVRYKKIKVKYQTEKFETRIKTYEGFTAQIIQHECDHLNGILI